MWQDFLGNKVYVILLDPEKKDKNEERYQKRGGKNQELISWLCAPDVPTAPFPLGLQMCSVGRCCWSRVLKCTQATALIVFRMEIC